MTHPLRAITEGVLAEIEDAARAARQSDDPAVRAAYAQRAANEDVPMLTKVLRKAWAHEGGDLGRELRDAAREWLLKKGTDGRDAAYAPDVELADIRVQSITGTDYIVIDLRLKVGGVR